MRAGGTAIVRVMRVEREPRDDAERRSGAACAGAARRPYCWIFEKFAVRTLPFMNTTWAVSSTFPVILSTVKWL